jgi:prostatic aicd phosphatase
MQEMTDKSYVYNVFNSELKRLKGGVFVKKALNDWREKIDDRLKEKIFVFAGHDSTVTNILSAFNVWDLQFPDYGESFSCFNLLFAQISICRSNRYCRNTRIITEQRNWRIWRRDIP